MANRGSDCWTKHCSNQNWARSVWNQVRAETATVYKNEMALIQSRLDLPANKTSIEVHSPLGAKKGSMVWVVPDEKISHFRIA